MKTQLLLWMALCLGASMVQAQNVSIPDANFKAAIIANFIDTNNDGEIQVSEARAAPFLLVSQQNISDLTGIQEFTNLRSLDCSNNNLSGTLDLSMLSSLTLLYVNDNQLTSLVVSNLATNLAYYRTRNNNLTTIPFPSSTTELLRLECDGNQLTVLNIPDVDTLNLLDCHGNMLTSLDLSGATNLDDFNCSYNNITSLSLPIAPNLNPSGHYINDLNCSHNQLDKLDYGFWIKYLDCGNNLLDTLHVLGKSGPSEVLRCDSNQIVDFSFENIDTVYCKSNQLTEIFTFGGNDFRYLDCSYNNIRDVLINPGNLSYMDFSNNDLVEMQFNGLLNRTNSNFDARNNPNLWCIAFGRSADANYARVSWTNVDNAVVFGSPASVCTPIWLNSVEVEALSEITLYPNPTTGTVQIDLGQTYEEVRAEVYSTTGQLLLSRANEGQVQLSLELPETNGLYLVVVRTKQGQRSFTVLKQ